MSWSSYAEIVSTLSINTAKPPNNEWQSCKTVRLAISDVIEGTKCGGTSRVISIHLHQIEQLQQSRHEHLQIFSTSRTWKLERPFILHVVFRFCGRIFHSVDLSSPWTKWRIRNFYPFVFRRIIADVDRVDTRIWISNVQCVLMNHRFKYRCPSSNRCNIVLDLPINSVYDVLHHLYSKRS